MNERRSLYTAHFIDSHDCPMIIEVDRIESDKNGRVDLFQNGSLIGVIHLAPGQHVFLTKNAKE